MDWLELDKVNPNYVTVATWAIGLLFAFVLARYALIPHLATNREKRILDTRDWDDIITDLNPELANRYFGAIAASTRWFDRIYGPHLLGWRALGRSINLALIYSVASLIFGWIFFDVGNSGGYQFLPAGLDFNSRIIFSCTSFGGTIFLVWILKNETYLKKKLLTKFTENAVPNTEKWLFGLDKIWGILHSIFVAIILFCLVMLGKFGDFLPLFSVFFISSMALVFFKNSLEKYVTLIPAILVVIIIFSYAVAKYFDFYVSLSIYFEPPFFSYTVRDFESGGFPYNFELPLFVSVLPILNASVDYVSVAATRHFLRRIRPLVSSAFSILLGVTIDILVAILCLGLLLFLITQTMDIWQSSVPIPMKFDWRVYRDTLCEGDWQQGTMLWLMLITTLLPTVLHLALGVGAMLSHSAQIDAQISAIIFPAYDRLKASHSVEKGDGKLASKLLTAAQVQSLVDLLGKKEGMARVWTAVLFVGFMALLIWGTVAVGRFFAMPWLCPAP